MPHPLRHEVDGGRAAERVSRALAHIDCHLDSELNADTLADRAAMSRHHFHRVFRAHVGCSVGGYVTWRRLQRACALLASGDEPVLDVALAVGYDSAQALAKAMRRELDTTPSALRRGDSAPWKSLLIPERLPFAATLQQEPCPMDAIEPSRFATLPQGLIALTATARGMVDHHMSRAAEAAFAELMGAIGRAGRMAELGSVISIVPDDAHGPDDPHCRFVAGALFGHDMARGEGPCRQPDVALTGSMAWQALDPGAYAVFTHKGPYTRLHETWRGIYVGWLPASGRRLRDAPPLELCLNNPRTASPEALLTEIWLPLQD